jgi:hypoxanthine phosphoribosyltransferase
MRRTSAMDAMRSASLEDCIEQSHHLAALVASSYEPDCVAAVLNGGVLPAMIVAHDLGLQERLFGLRVRRKRNIEGIYHVLPRTAGKLIQGIYYLCSQPVVEPGGPAVPGRHVLVVDDRADTESSLKVAASWLQRTSNPTSIRTAVLSWLGRWPPRMPPDFHVHRGMLKFPWSANAAPENPDYLAEYQAFMLRHAAYLSRRGIELQLPRERASVAVKPSAPL